MSSADLQLEVAKLSDEELSERLVELGFTRTPITEMTRKYLQKQLVLKLTQSYGLNIDDTNDKNLNGKDSSEERNQNNKELNTDFHSNNRATEMPPLYYAVYWPNDSNDVSSRVFYEKEMALQYVKKNKRSRFKAFKTYSDASNFATFGLDIPVNSILTLASKPIAAVTTVAFADGASRFKGPKSQDLVILRKAIERGDIMEVKKMVWENPRYLVGSGDTPSILQEGARYNALHIAAKALNADMTALLLETVSDVKFIQLLYGIELEDNCRQRANIFLDLYLNTPDKGQNDTPLHLAVKFGAVRVVEVLVSYPECDKYRANKFSKTPKQVICERMKSVPEGLKEEIRLLLDDAYFVPVLRSVDAVEQPAVGDTFSTKKPLVTNSDPLSPHMDVSAYAGPMDCQQAETFRRRWKTPPRVKTNMTFTVARLNDLDRGLEREGRELAKQFKIKWREYWPFLGVYTDFYTTEGILKLEAHLKEKFELMSSEMAARVLNETPKTPSASKRYTNVLSPMSDLCVALTSCTLTDKSLPNTPVNAVSAPVAASVYQDPTTSLSPIVYIEKTCHVLARRLSDGIYNALQTSEDNLCLSKNLKDVIHSEVLNMQKLINSFRSNTCFTKINFSLIHSRISVIIPFFLDDNTQSYDLMRICTSLQILTSKLPQHDESSDEDDKYINYRVRQKSSPFCLGEQVACLSQLIIHALNRPGGRALNLADTEPEVKAVWARCTECFCTWNASPPLTRAMRKGSSLKRNFVRNMEEPSGRTWSRQEAEQVVTCLPNDDEDQSETSETEESKADEDSVSVDGDQFYTPPSSVTSEDVDMEEFELPQEGFPVFLDGKLPTKLDVDVLRALNQDLLTKEEFPNVWRWRHELMQFTDQERSCWPSPARLGKSFNEIQREAQSPGCSPVTHRKIDRLTPMWGSAEPPFASPKRRLDL